MDTSSGLGGIAAHWPTMWLILRIMFGLLLLSPLLIWPVATRMRHRAYGPGGGRRASTRMTNADWLYGSDRDRGDPMAGFDDLPVLGHDADLSPGPRLGDGWKSAAPYGGTFR